MAVDVREVVEQAREAMTGRRVFSEPYERNGVTVILASRVRGGGGGGAGQEGSAPERQGQTGWGGGFGISATPVGAFVIRGEEVRWIPAFDLTQVIAGGQIVAVVALLTLRRILRSRRRR
ncbi:MAG TPA: spore germination protein GerW family protein [Candidatus Dormibacteraeota bacterium]|nr:spore germination protein GerW family protein [Candidatus Dormibacteraeota bacterium]